MTRRWVFAASLAGLALVLPGCELPPVCDEDLGAGSPPGCVELNEPPQADIVVFPAQNDPVPIVGKKLNFVASTIDPDGDPLYVEWDFDSDGEVDQAHYADTSGLGDHIYHSSGRKLVTLRVSDFPGLPGGEGQVTKTRAVRVFSEEEVENDHSPIASFTATPNPALRNETIRFDASASHDPDNDQAVTGFTWRFTDPAGQPAGGTNTDRSVYETSFAEAGQYTAELDVTSEGPLFSPALARTAQPVTILEHAAPVAELSAVPNPALIEQRVNFDASRSTDAENDIQSYEFDLDGNGSYETVTGGPTASRAYFQSGTVRPAVRVTDVHGNAGVATVELNVEGGGDPGHRARARAGGAKLELPFSARIEGNRFTGTLPNPPGRASKLEAAARGLIESRFRSKLRTRPSATGTVETKGIAVARGKGQGRVCLGIALATAPESATTGGVRILGGSGAGARLRGRATLRAVLGDAGEIQLVGGLEIRRDRARALPERCARLAGR